MPLADERPDFTRRRRVARLSAGRDPRKRRVRALCYPRNKPEMMQATRHSHPLSLVLLSILVASFFAACGGGGEEAAETSGGKVDVTIPADVPFDPAQWTTATDYADFGDAAAKRELQDRPFTITWQTFPPTLRT